jgi:hypothetical protein
MGPAIRKNPYLGYDGVPDRHTQQRLDNKRMNRLEHNVEHKTGLAKFNPSHTYC